MYKRQVNSNIKVIKFNYMKYIYNITIIFMLALLLLNSCQDETVSSDKTPPKQITNVEFTALNGGAVSYTHLDVYKRQEWDTYCQTSHIGNRFRIYSLCSN